MTIRGWQIALLSGPPAGFPWLVKLPIRIQFCLITPRDTVSLSEDAFLAVPENEAVSVITMRANFPFRFQRRPQ